MGGPDPDTLKGNPMPHPILEIMPQLADRLARMHPDQWGGLHPTAELAALCDRLGSAHHPDYRKAANARFAAKADKAKP